jgi:hypothetical protein
MEEDRPETGSKRMTDLLVPDTSALKPVTAETILGSWQLVSVRRRILESGKVVEPFGPAPSGMITYGADGHVLVVFVGSNRPQPESLAAITDTMRAELHRTMCAYAGSWILEGTRIRHRIAVSWNELWSGTEEARNLGLNGAGQLILWTDPNRGIADGTYGVSTFTWQRPSTAAD